jgi:MFS transporter, DHA1 family, multidrug resistance protein
MQILSSKKTIPSLPSARELIAMMAALMALNALAIDTMLPGFQAMRESLRITNPNAIQYVISIYLLGMGFGSIVYGPLSDRYGRKAVLVPAIIGYAAFSFACRLSPSFEFLLAMRLAQGLCGAAMGVLVAAIIRDSFDGDKMARHMSTIFMVFMIVPVIAPSIGALIIKIAPWRSIFDVFALLGILIAFWVARRLPETLDPANVILIQPKTIISGWKAVATHRSALGYIIAGGIVQGALFGYLNASEQLFSVTFKARDFFPIGFAIVALGIAAANFTNSRIVERFGARRVSHFALFLFILFGLLQLLAGIYVSTSLPLFLILITCNMALIGFLGSNFSSISMQPFGKMAGVASSFQQAARTILGAVIGAVIGGQYTGSVAPIAIGFSLCGVASVVFVLWGEKGRLFTRPGTTKLEHVTER